MYACGNYGRVGNGLVKEVTLEDSVIATRCSISLRTKCVICFYRVKFGGSIDEVVLCDGAMNELNNAEPTVRDRVDWPHLECRKLKAYRSG